MACANGVQTRRLYALETLADESCYLREENIVPFRLVQARSLEYLKLRAEKIWEASAPVSIQCPEIRSTRAQGGFVSFCNGPTIYLGENSRNLLYLIHELTHTLTLTTIERRGELHHGRRFVRRYFDLLVRHGSCELGKLVTLAGLVKLEF